MGSMGMVAPASSVWRGVSAASEAASEERSELGGSTSSASEEAASEAASKEEREEECLDEPVDASEEEEEDLLFLLLRLLFLGDDWCCEEKPVLTVLEIKPAKESRGTPLSPSAACSSSEETLPSSVLSRRSRCLLCFDLDRLWLFFGVRLFLGERCCCWWLVVVVLMLRCFFFVSLSLLSGPLRIDCSNAAVSLSNSTYSSPHPAVFLFLRGIGVLRRRILFGVGGFGGWWGCR